MTTNKKLITLLAGIGLLGIAGAASAAPVSGYTVREGGFARIGTVPTIQRNVALARGKNDALFTAQLQKDAAKKKHGKHKGWRRFELMDMNHDGKVDRREMTIFQQRQIEQRFSRLDLNADGYITKAELKQAKAKMKKSKGHAKGKMKKKGPRFTKAQKQAWQNSRRG